MDEQHRMETLTSEETEFKREIGVFGGVSIIGGIMIGSGIFYLGAYVLERVGMDPGLALLCWVIGGLITLMGGLCYAELGTMMPRAGGRLIYLNEAYHPSVGFLSGFTDWLIGGPGSVASIAIALPTALMAFAELNEATIKITAIALIIVLTIYNCYGVKGSTGLQNLSMIAKVIPLALIMFAALFMGDMMPDFSFSIGREAAAATNKSIIGMVAFAVVATLWAYEGWTNLNTVCEEIKNPKKNLPLSLFFGIGGVMLLYILFNFSIFRVLPQEEIVGMIGRGDFYLGTAVAEKVFGSTGAIIVVVGMILAMFSALNGLIMAQPRMYYAMAKEGHFFKSYKYLHPVHKVPTVAIIVQGIIAIILVLVRNLEQLTTLVVFSGMIFNVLSILAVPICRRKFPNVERPYKVWAYPFSVYLTALIFIGLVINTFIEDPITSITSVLVLLLGLICFWYFDKKKKVDELGTKV